MRKFQTTIKLAFPATDEEHARNITDELLGVLRGEVEDMELIASDVAIMPRSNYDSEYPMTVISDQGVTKGRITEDDVVEVEPTFLGQSNVVTHPWDQGAWIFPDDHPLAGYERAARGLDPNDTLGHKSAMLAAGVAMQALPYRKTDDDG